MIPPGVSAAASLTPVRLLRPNLRLTASGGVRGPSQRHGEPRDGGAHPAGQPAAGRLLGHRPELVAGPAADRRGGRPECRQELGAGELRGQVSPPVRRSVGAGRLTAPPVVVAVLAGFCPHRQVEVKMVTTSSPSVTPSEGGSFGGRGLFDAAALLHQLGAEQNFFLLVLQSIFGASAHFIAAVGC